MVSVGNYLKSVKLQALENATVVATVGKKAGKQVLNRCAMVTRRGKAESQTL